MRRDHERETARDGLTAEQQLVGAVLLVATGLGVLLAPGATALVAVGTSMLFLTCFMGLRLVLVVASRGYRPLPVDAVADEDLPPYTTLHPLYDEANMIPAVVAAMDALDYPKDRLQCLLVLEERDSATLAAARAADLPAHVGIVVVPPVPPFGKPKACNYALQFATGEFVVIYDAEDRPDPDQLRQAVGTFRAAERTGTRLGCAQARLVFENEVPLHDEHGRVLRDDEGFDVRPTTWTSRLLGNEYAVHFDLVLAGLARLRLPVPLGGTSNHFPLHVLRRLAFPPDQVPRMAEHDASIGAWDPWNVTEDAELGGALAAAGWRTSMLDSSTQEEACLTARAALNQRSRWVKGYLQTALVLLRHPVRAALAMGPAAYVAFLLQVGGTALSLALSPVFWTIFAIYAATGSPRIIALFPGPLYYTGMALLLGGNLALLSTSLYAAVARGRFGTVRHLLLALPVWWCLLSLATYVAVLELVFPAWRPSWNKTAHGVRHLGLARRTVRAAQARVAWAGALVDGLVDGVGGGVSWRSPVVPQVVATSAAAVSVAPLLPPHERRGSRGRPVRVVPRHEVRFLAPERRGVAQPAAPAAASVQGPVVGPVVGVRVPEPRRQRRVPRQVPKPEVRWLQAPPPRLAPLPDRVPAGVPAQERRPAARVPVREPSPLVWVPGAEPATV